MEHRMDILFNTSDAASNNLNLSILYTMDCYFKMGLSNAATQYMSHPTDNEAAQTFNSCFTGYVNFQIYGNHTAKSWISSVTDGGALNHAFTYIFYRENLKNASELKNLCDSQNKTRSQILNIICKYQDIYSNLYMKDEYKQAMSQPITPTPVVDSKDYNISEGITSPNTVEESGKCGDSAYWKLFKDGTMIIYGTGNLYDGSVKISCDRNNVKKIEITEGITKIGMHALEKCRQIKSIKLPNTVKEIRSDAFAYCDSLVDIKGGSNLEEIGPSAFEGCVQLKSFIIPNTVKNIGPSAFRRCKQLQSITIPDTVKNIGTGAFEDCESLTDVKGGNGLEKIGGFKGCKQLKNITIPDSVKIIDSSAFMECRSLTTVKGGANVEKIYKEAFCWCPQLKNIIIPDTERHLHG